MAKRNNKDRKKHLNVEIQIGFQSNTDRKRMQRAQYRSEVNKAKRKR